MDGDTRERMVDTHRGNTLSNERRSKIVESLRGRRKDEHTRQRTMVATSGLQNPPGAVDTVVDMAQGGRSPEMPSASETEPAVTAVTTAERRLEIPHLEPVRAGRENRDRDLESANERDNLVSPPRRCHTEADDGKISVDPPEGDADGDPR